MTKKIVSMAPLCLALVVVTRNKNGGDVAESSKELDFHKVFFRLPLEVGYQGALIVLVGVALTNR